MKQIQMITISLLCCSAASLAAETVPLNDSQLDLPQGQLGAYSTQTPSLMSQYESYEHQAEEVFMSRPIDMKSIKEDHNNRAQQAVNDLRARTRSLQAIIDRHLTAVWDNPQATISKGLFSAALTYDSAYDRAMQACVFIGRVLDDSLKIYRAACTSSDQKSVTESLLHTGIRQRLEERLAVTAFTPIDMSSDSYRITALGY